MTDIKKHNAVLGFIFLLCLCHITAFAQCRVQGKVVDQKGGAMPLVNVAFFSSQDSTLVSGTMTDSLGGYDMVLTAGKYIARYSFLSCRTIYKEIKVESKMELPVIRMELLPMVLDEVKVTAKKPMLRLTGSGLVVDVENDGILRRQNDIYDLLGRIPGIIQMGHSVQVVGKSSFVFYINGRKVMDASEVDNLQVDQIKSVKVVTGTDVSYNVGNSAVIDIRTKRLGEGLALNVTGNLTQGKYMSPKAGFYSSYNIGKWDFFLSYYYGRTKLQEETFSTVQTLASTVWNKDEYARSLSATGSHSYKGGVAYHFSPESSLGLQYIGDYRRARVSSKDTVLMVPNNGTPSFMNTDGISATNTTNHHINFYYDTKLGNSWSLNTCADYVNRLQNGNRNLLENDYISEEKAVSYTRKSRWNVAAANVHASYSSEKYGDLAFGYDFSHSWGRDNLVYKSRINDDRTRNRETKNALFIKYSRPFGDFTLEAGLRYELVHSVQDNEVSTGHESHSTHNFLPSLSLSHSKGMLMQSLNAYVETTRPDFTDMNGNVDYQNRYSISLGNPGLKSSTGYNFNYTLMYKFLYLSIGYDYTCRPISGNFYGLAENPSVMVGRVENFSDRQGLTGTLYLRHTIKWWTPMFSLVCMKSFADYPGPEGKTLHNGCPVVLGTLASDCDLSNGYMLSARFDYNFGGYLETYKIRPYSSLNLSLKKSFMKDRLRLSIDAYDLFKKGYTKALWNINNLKMNMRMSPETRKFGITLTWRFRKSKEMNRQSAASEEMSRLKLNEAE